jgi:hypothetical protein
MYSTINAVNYLSHRGFKMENKRSKIQIWRDEHREEIRERQRKIRNTPERKQYLKEFRLKNKERKLLTDQKHRWDHKVKTLSLVAQGGVIECIKCGIRDKRILQIHHKLGNGERDRKFYYKTNVAIRVNNSKGNVNVEELEIRCCNCNILAEYEELNRRYTNIISFDENFDPIWRVLPQQQVPPLEPLICDQCQCVYMPLYRRERKHHFCSKECYRIFIKSNGYPNHKNKENGRYESSSEKLRNDK